MSMGTILTIINIVTGIGSFLGPPPLLSCGGTSAARKAVSTRSSWMTSLTGWMTWNGRSTADVTQIARSCALAAPAECVTKRERRPRGAPPLLWLFRALPALSDPSRNKTGQDRYHEERDREHFQKSVQYVGHEVTSSLVVVLVTQRQGRASGKKDKPLRACPRRSALRFSSSARPAFV